MIFQDILSDYFRDTQKLRETLDHNNYRSEFISEWKEILQKDYNPIFHVAREVLKILPNDSESNKALKSLAQTCLEITENRTPLRLDLMGRIFHGLLRNPKHTGTFYTHVPSATLLVDLALAPDGASVDWSNINMIRKMRIADLACGTGTLLKACIETISDNYHDICADKKKAPSMRSLHSVLLEEVLYGFDIFPYCINLSASALALHYPEVSFRKMNVYSLPYGFKHRAMMGSLDFLKSDTIRVGGESISLPMLDACVINPPYTRSVGMNLLFGILPEDQRNKTQVELRKIVRTRKLPANVTAGLATVFVALADSYIKPNGHFAAVLPKALLSGLSWIKTRKLLSNKYHIKYLISCHDNKKWNFTENQKMAEVLIVAKKLSSSDSEEHQTIFVNLSKRPDRKVVASQIARRIRTVNPADFISTGISELKLGSKYFGEAIQVNSEFMRTQLWTYPAFFVHTDLSRVTYYLSVKQRLYIPGSSKYYPIHLCKLSTLAGLGMDRRDIWDGFEETSKRTAYAGLHGHLETHMNCIAQKPNGYYAPLARARRGRKLRSAHIIWARRARLMITDRLSTRTNSLTTVLLDRPAIAGVWWSVKLLKENKDFEKIIALWLNSTLGILTFLPFTVITSPRWVSMKKGNVKNLPLIDPRKLNKKQVKALVALYNSISQETFLPLSRLNEDTIRISVDDKFQQILNLPDLSTLRDLLVNEPVMSIGGDAEEVIIDAEYDEDDVT